MCVLTPILWKHLSMIKLVIMQVDPTEGLPRVHLQNSSHDYLTGREKLQNTLRLHSVLIKQDFF